jgi:hypothetical protein
VATNWQRRCDVILTLTILIAIAALVIIERFGGDRWTIVSGPTLLSLLAAGGLGITASLAFLLCSLSPQSGNSWATRNNYLRHNNSGSYFLRVFIWLFLICITVGFVALAYVRVASEYLPGINFSDKGRIIAINRATRWQNPCDRSVDVMLDSGRAIHFCQSTAWGQSIGSEIIDVGGRVDIHLRKTPFFEVVTAVARDSN